MKWRDVQPGNVFTLNGIQSGTNDAWVVLSVGFDAKRHYGCMSICYAFLHELDDSNSISTFEVDPNNWVFNEYTLLGEV